MLFKCPGWSNSRGLVGRTRLPRQSRSCTSSRTLSSVTPPLAVGANQELAPAHLYLHKENTTHTDIQEVRQQQKVADEQRSIYRNSRLLFKWTLAHCSLHITPQLYVTYKTTSRSVLTNYWSSLSLQLSMDVTDTDNINFSSPVSPLLHPL